MEAAVEAAAPPPPSRNIVAAAKGKRTKRQRPHSPRALNLNNTTEDVDTARCLVLLSRGYFARSKHSAINVYTCKTCNRSFPSFQALGGHRTSHKKPRNDFLSLSPLSLQLSTATFVSSVKLSPSPRIHECSCCGAEFSSGQALGGHMRKHRAGPVVRSSGMIVEAAAVVEPMESKSLIVLSLDLNLPAPDDDKEKSPQGTNQRLVRPGFSHHYYSTIDGLQLHI